MPTLRDYRRALSEKLGPLKTLTTTAVGTSASSLVVSGLIDDEAPTSTFSQLWVYVTSGALSGSQRRLRASPFSPSTGGLETTAPFGGTPVSGVEFELHSYLPVLAESDAGHLRSKHQCINMALQKLWFRDRLAIAGVTNQAVYTLTSFPWLTNDRRILDVYMPLSTGQIIPTKWTGEIGFRYDGESPVLEFPGAPFRTGETFWIDVIRPSNSRLQLTGSWADQTDLRAELVDDLDEAISDVGDVVAVALQYAYEGLASIASTSGERKDWDTRAQKQALLASNAKRKHLQRDDRVGTTSISFSGTTSGTSGSAPAAASELTGQLLGENLVAGSTTLSTTAASALSSVSVPCWSVRVQNDPDNTYDMLIGDATNQYYQLSPGDSIALAVSDVTAIYAKNLTSSTQHARWIAMTSEENVLITPGVLTAGTKTLNAGSPALAISATSLPTSAVRVQSDPDNTVEVFIGDASIVTSLTPTAYYQLSPGDSIALEVENVNLVYGYAASTTPTLNWLSILQDS